MSSRKLSLELYFSFNPESNLLYSSSASFMEEARKAISSLIKLMSSWSFFSFLSRLSLINDRLFISFLRTLISSALSKVRFLAVSSFCSKSAISPSMAENTSFLELKTFSIFESSTSISLFFLSASLIWTVIFSFAPASSLSRTNNLSSLSLRFLQSLLRSEILPSSSINSLSAELSFL